MKKITILSVIALAALTLGMITPNFGLHADATGNNNNNNNNGNHNDDDDCDDDRKKSYGGNHDDDCDNDDDKGKNKPTVKIYKVVINNQGNTPRVIGDFGVKLNDTLVTANGTSFTLKPNQPVTLTESGLVGYEFVEIRGDGHCPENLGGTITLSKGQNIECYIVNQPTGTSGGGVSEPPTVNVYVIIANHEGTYPSFTDFGVKLNNAPITQNGTADIQIPTNTPVTLSATGVSGYELAQIQGDGSCPANLGGTITLANGQHVECYIVNQPAGQDAPVEPGVIFHYNTLVLDAGNKYLDDSCSVAGSVLPCVELANVNETNSLLVVDEELQTDTTIVLFSVVEADRVNIGQSASSPLCVLSGMKQHTTIYANNQDESPVDQPSGKLGFEVNCSLIESVKYKFSYALIETNRGP